MNVSVLNKQIQAVAADALIVNLFEGVTSPGGATGALDTALGASDGVPGDGMISELIKLGDFKGKLNDVAVLYPHGLIPASRVFVVGLGKSGEFNLDRVRQASGAAVRRARDLGCKRVTTIVHGSGIGGLPVRDAAQATAEGALLGAYQFREHKRNGSGGKDIDELVIVEYDRDKLGDVQAGVNDGRAVASAINASRDLINRAPNVLTPVVFAEAAKTMAERVGLQCTVLTEAEISEHKMGGVLAVTQGSLNPPRFVVLEHVAANANDPSTNNQQPLMFIGKGVTFDTGGISIKPAEGMGAMKGDMAGAAAVFGAMEAVAGLKLPHRVVGLIPLVENMPSDRAYRPGDVITMMSGLTVEIISTDAEGRVILADALHYAKRFQPAGAIDLATLTGTASLAMGEGMGSAAFMNDEAWAGRVLAAAGTAGERMWRMPLYAEYNDKIRSDVAEIKNSGGRSGGLGASAYFLKRFVEEDGKDAYPWAHVDMAGLAFTNDSKGYNPKGALGYGIRTLVELAKAG